MVVRNLRNPCLKKIKNERQYDTVGLCWLLKESGDCENPDQRQWTLKAKIVRGEAAGQQDLGE